MTKTKPFNESQFTPTQWDTAADKANWANDLIAFIESGFDPKKFTEKLYKRLSMCFSHIAHYNSSGFWGEWFSSPIRQWKWILHIMESSCLGDPAFTYSDVEKAVCAYITHHPDLLETIIAKAKAFERANDEIEFERLKAKLGK